MKVKALKLYIFKAGVRVGSNKQGGRRETNGINGSAGVQDTSLTPPAVPLDWDRLSPQWPPMLISSPGASILHRPKVERDFGLTPGHRQTPSTRRTQP